MKKTKQHYVWQYYLGAWAKNQQVFCLRNNEVFLTNTINIAQQRDFYRLNELTDGDIFILRELIKKSPLFLQPLNADLLNDFILPFELKKIYTTLGEYDKNFEYNIEITINNLEEDLHCNIEEVSVKYINLIRAEDISFYNNDVERMKFLLFLFTQYLRTNRMKERIRVGFENFPNSYNGISFSMDRMWNVLSHILATNLAFTIFDENKMNLHLIKNNTGIPFITCDQPVVNMKANSDYKKPTNEIEIFYPQTPYLALILAESINVSYLSNISVESIKKFNDLIVSTSHEQVYSNNKSILEQYIT